MDIVCLQDGNGATAYCLPSAAGTVEGYLELVKAIGPGHLIYGIQLADRQESGKFTAFASLQDMAAVIARELLARHRGGPICLIGYSFAGFLAVEVARQMTGQGGTVPLVTFIAVRGPSPTVTPLVRATHFVRNVGPWALRVAARSATNPKYRTLYRNKLPGYHKFVGMSWYENLPKEYQEYITNNDANLKSYRFDGAYRGKILLFRKRFVPELEANPLRFDHLEDYGWGSVTGASVEVVHTPDEPTAMMMHKHGVREIANAVHAALNESDRSRIAPLNVGVS